MASTLPAAGIAGSMLQKLSSVNESVWMQIGGVAELMNDYDRAMSAYENALRQNPYSIPAMTQIAGILRAREHFGKAVEYLQSILNLDGSNGEVWGSLGHCYLMMDDLQKAYSAYQQALYHLRDPKEPKLWYGIGILYDRYGSLEHAEEAFSQVMRMQPDFEKANEIYFRLGIIYKQQHKYQQSLECFRYILGNPPRPLTELDIWFQIGHVHEQQKDYKLARDAYDKALAKNPTHGKVLQQLGWLYHQQNSTFSNQDLAIQYLTKSLEADGQDAQSWYLLGRCYMAQQKYNKAYEAYQQAVYRDGRNPTFWCSIGVLYYQINQYRDALDAYSRAVRLNPYISEVWYDLGTLYESCNNQINDALDAYQRAAELDPSNPHIKQRLQLLRSGQAGGPQHANSAPPPQDINPQAYQVGVSGPLASAGWTGQPPSSQATQPPPPPPQAQSQRGGNNITPVANGPFRSDDFRSANQPATQSSNNQPRSGAPQQNAIPGVSSQLQSGGTPSVPSAAQQKARAPFPAHLNGVSPAASQSQQGQQLPQSPMPQPQQPQQPSSAQPTRMTTAAGVTTNTGALASNAGPSLAPIVRHASPAQEVKPSLEDTPSGKPRSPKPGRSPTLPGPPLPGVANDKPAAMETSAAATSASDSNAGSGGVKRSRDWASDRETSAKKAALSPQHTVASATGEGDNDQTKERESASLGVHGQGAATSAEREEEPAARKMVVDENYDDDDDDSAKKPLETAITENVQSTPNAAATASPPADSASTKSPHVDADALQENATVESQKLPSVVEKGQNAENQTKAPTDGQESSSVTQPVDGIDAGIKEAGIKSPLASANADEEESPAVVKVPSPPASAATTSFTALNDRAKNDGAKSDSNAAASEEGGAV